LKRQKRARKTRLDGGKRVDRAAESVNNAKAANDDDLRLQSANETKMPRGYFTTVAK